MVKAEFEKYAVTKADGTLKRRVLLWEEKDKILNELKELDLSQMTPIEAMNKLYELQNKVKNRW